MQSSLARVVLPSEIEICKTADGRDWLLGDGTFGEVSGILRTFIRPRMSLSPRRLPLKEYRAVCKVTTGYLWLHVALTSAGQAVSTPVRQPAR